jgi:hypothetical protein
MPFNGSGTFNRIYSWTVDAANSVAISSSRTDAEMNGFAAGLSNCITRDGQSPPSADLPMGGKRLMNLGTAAAGTDALNRDTADARYAQTGFSLTLSNGGAGAASGSTFNGTANLTISYNSIGAAPAASPTFTGTITFATNNMAVKFTDANSGNPYFICQADNNFVFNGTDGAGAARPVWSVGMHSASSSLNVLVPATALTPATADNSTSIATTAFVNAQGYATATSLDALKDVPQNAQTATYTLALTDRGKHISITTGGVVIPANSSVAFPIGATVGIYNNSGSSQTISITTDTLTLAGTATTGTRTLAQHGFATILKVGTTNWIITGAGLT